MKQLAVFRIPDLPRELQDGRDRLEISHQYLHAVLRQIGLPILDFFVIEPDQLEGLRKAIAVPIGFDSELEVMAHSSHPDHNSAQRKAAYLLWVLKDLARICLIAKEHNLSLEWLSL